MDEENLIAKKEVLRQTGISYGQLYRWKRKGLIPEAWFVRKSTFTGQETFFPRDKILERVERIKEMKDSLPLDDLADAITQQVNAKVRVTMDRLRRTPWFDETAARECGADATKAQALSLADALCIAVASRLRSAARPEERALVQSTLRRNLNESFLEQAVESNLHVHLLRKKLSAGGISAEISLVAIAPSSVLFDADVVRVETVDLKNTLERIKLDLAQEPGGPRGGAASGRREEEP
jgi:DNA-binding transcriptional MerR regulator